MNRAMIASIIAAAAAGAAFAQPVQWRVEDGGNGHWYEYSAQTFSSFLEARDFAASRGGHLATLTTSTENDFVASIHSGHAVLGGFQDLSATDYSEPAGGWRWITGEPWAFTAWQGGEPNNGASACCENKLMFWRFEGAIWNNRWNDVAEHWDANWVPAAAVIEWDADCNNDGIVDYGQILSGELQDANHNGIPDGSVSIARQPVDQSVGVDQPVFFVVETVTTPSCTTPVAYRWQRRNPLVADETAADAWLDLQDGGGFLNTGTPSLTILRPTPALATGYRCRISGGCGCEGTVGGATFTNTVNFGVACPADFNADGGIDFGDIEAFFERWENGC